MTSGVSTTTDEPDPHFFCHSTPPGAEDDQQLPDLVYHVLSHTVKWSLESGADFMLVVIVIGLLFLLSERSDYEMVEALQ